MGRAIVFGATGFTGRLAATACVEAGLPTVLAGRDRDKLEKLAAELGGCDVAVADADQPSSVRRLLEPGDALISTVGPYLRYGAAALEAAVDAGAHYLDLAGEPAFVRRVFDEFGPRAEQSGITLLPSFGHDWVHGNLAAAIALREAGGRARRVDVAYFDYVAGSWFTGAPMAMFTSGTRATLASAEPPESFVVQHGQLVRTRLGKRVRSFVVDGRRMSAMSYGGTEHLALRRIAPELDDVEVYLGWLGQASRLMSVTIGGMQVASRLPIVRRLLQARYERALAVTGEGPTSWPDDGVCRTIAETFDEDGTALARADLDAPVDAYRLSGQLLAWAAGRLLAGDVLRAGACGPVDAFGLDVLEPELARLGMRRLEVPTPAPAA